MWSRQPLSIALIGLGLASAAVDVNVLINPAIQFQEVDGFGLSGAFGGAENILGSAGLSQQGQQKLLNMFFDVDDGAGFTILRNAIGSSNYSDIGNMLSIELNNPGSPDSKPTYTPNDNTDQLPLARKAYSRGLQMLYADAWSAPWFMKNNSADYNGGSLCGVSGVHCESGNWIPAYVHYLLEYVQLYKRAGVEVTHIGFLNEPQLNRDYASMLSTGQQAADVIRVLAKVIKQRGLDLKINCCDAFNWESSEAMLPGLKEGPDPAINYLDIYTGHGYGSPPNFQLSTTLKTWVTEWADLSSDYTPYTFFGDGVASEGLTWASNIQVAFAKANVSAFLYWEGAQDAITSACLVNLNGDEILYTKHFWAMFQFSRFVRPGARRIRATSSVKDVTVTSFENTNGVYATQILNNQTSAIDLSVRFVGGLSNSSLVPHVTNNAHNFTTLAAVQPNSGGVFKFNLPARSLVSLVSE